MDPKNCKYTEEHEWVLIEGAEATVGISQFAADELGEIVFVELPEENDTLNAKDELGTVESVKTVSSIYAPISGTVTAINTELENAPNLVNDSPFETGWLVKLTNIDAASADSLMSHDEYQDFLQTLE